MLLPKTTHPHWQDKTSTPLLHCGGSADRWRRGAPGADVFLPCCAATGNHWCCCRCSVLNQPGTPAEATRATYSSIPWEMCTEQSLWLPNPCVLVTRRKESTPAQTLGQPETFPAQQQLQQCWCSSLWCLAGAGSRALPNAQVLAH